METKGLLCRLVALGRPIQVSSASSICTLQHGLSLGAIWQRITCPALITRGTRCCRELTSSGHQTGSVPNRLVIPYKLALLESRSPLLAGLCDIDVISTGGHCADFALLVLAVRSLGDSRRTFRMYLPCRGFTVLLILLKAPCLRCHLLNFSRRPASPIPVYYDGKRVKWARHNATLQMGPRA